MTRVKKGVNALKNRRNTLKKTKGYRFGRSNKERAANEALVHAGKYAFAHRKDKKNDFRRLWNVRISATLKSKGTSYSKFINVLKNKKVTLDRKVLAGLAQNNPETFTRLLQKIS
ncbi:MAG: 50S ribosomal protein L20 [Patescibacteria group bacterium]